MDRIEDSDEVNKETQALLLAMRETVGDYSIEILRDSLGSRPLVNFDDVEDDDLLGLAYLKLDEVIRENLAMKETLRRRSESDMNAIHEQASRVVMTSEEREAQRRSFAFGNVHLANPSITREMIDRVATSISDSSKVSD